MKRHVSIFAIIFACIIFLARPGDAAPLDSQVPADAIVYAGWAGADSQAAQYDKSNLKGVIEASSIKQFMGTQLPALMQMAAARDPNAPQTIAKLEVGLSIAWHHPLAVYFCPVDMKDPAKPTVYFGLICDAGSDAKALADLLKEAIAQVPPDPDLPVRVTTDNTTVALRFGTPSSASSLTSAAPFSNSPFYVKAMAQVKQANPAVAIYVDAQHLRTMIEDALAKGPDVPPEVKAKVGVVIDALGLKSLTQFAFTGGFDGKGWTERAFVGVSGPRTGLLSLAGTTPVSDAILAAVPKDAASFSVGKFDLHKLFTEARTIAGKIDPRAQDQMDNAVATGNGMLQLDIEKDILAPLGDEWLFYRSPMEEGGLSLVFMNKLKDGPAFAKTLDTLETFFNEKSGASVKVEKIAAGKQKVSAITFLTYNVAWTVHNGYLFVSTLPGISAAMAQVDNQSPSIVTSDKYKAFMAAMPPGVKPTTISYAHPARLYPEMRVLALGVLPLLRAQGFSVPMDILPDPSVIAEFMPPGGMVTWSDADGDHAFGSSAFPGASMLGGQSMGNMGVAVAAVGAGVALPALGRVRMVPNDSIGVANLRGIARAAILYAGNHQDQMPDHLARLFYAGQISASALVDRGSNTKPFSMTADMVKLAESDFPKFAAQVDEHCDYVYLGKGMKSEMDSNLVLIFERPERAMNDGINLAFQDGHVEFVHFAALPEMFKYTNDYLAQHQLPRVSLNALVPGQAPGGTTISNLP